MTRVLTIEDMIGKVFTSVRSIDEDQLIFENEQESFTFCHHQDCCEYVYIESIVGNLEDLVGEPLLLAEERVSDQEPTDDSDSYDSYTWTFYTFATRKGYVDVRWYGSSNGYYSESVDMEHKKKVY